MLIFFFCKIPCPPKVFFLAFTAVNALPPPIVRPTVACYVSLNLLHQCAVLLFFPPESDDFRALDIYTPKGCFGLNFPRFRIGNSYARPLHPAPHSVSPVTALPALDFPYLVAGAFNIHNAATDPSRLRSSKEEGESAPYFNRATDLGYTLLNTLGIYSRFPFTGTHRPSSINLTFANPDIFRALRSWD